ncbi:unnamed protein product [Notodromas monacha]|uniref:Diphosphomevalonate decarboxylase n=1 Tax=Notodromas monacha TaxID=399045 RepID=A0A7R9GJ42_9CRUS|nr:unnamed protein product [Notodromas monacha]CAG0923242.1 unnamed protein product [Notodromas monacha]
MSSSGVTLTAPVNIALIKYWGKLDETAIIPTNDSLSFTLSQDDMCATTTAMTVARGVKSKFWLNGKEMDLGHPRIRAVVEEVRKIAKVQGTDETLLDLPVRIASINNFPTAAGLASSAAGYAAATAALGALYGVKGDLSRIARIGSGSACRSISGGFVRWIAGSTSEDSIAVQVAPENHWPSLRWLICVVRATPKAVGSTEGMRRTIQTSPLMPARIASVPDKISAITKAIQERNFRAMAELTMQDSNQFHAICLDTFPPLFYMNDVSHRIIDFVHDYNRVKGSLIAGYTFDAGPNACLFTEQENFDELASVVEALFSDGVETDFVKGMKPERKVDASKLLDSINVQPIKGGIKYAIGTKLGGGPRKIDHEKFSLLDANGELIDRA